MEIIGLRNLCNPAYTYMVISFIILFMIIFQSWTTPGSLCLGYYACDISNLSLIVFLKTVYILFWTWVLNLVCNYASPGVAWFLVLVPFILFFIVIASFMLS